MKKLFFECWHLNCIVLGAEVKLMRNTSRYARIISLMLFVAVFLTMTSTKSYAIPTLQLDLSGGTYNYDTSTIITSSDSFTLYAYLMPNSKNKLSDTYFGELAIADR